MALATIVGIVLSLVFKLVSIIRPETELVDDTLESINEHTNTK